MENVNFDYSKLRGRIIEIFGNQKEFAKAMGMSPVSVSLKLCNRSFFNQEEIQKAVIILGIEPGDVAAYFFTPKL